MLQYSVTSSLAVQGAKCRGVWQHWVGEEGTGGWFIDSAPVTAWSWASNTGILKGCKGCWVPHRCFQVRQVGTKKSRSSGQSEACIHSATGVCCRCLCSGRGRLQTHILLRARAGGKGWDHLRAL